MGRYFNHYPLNRGPYVPPGWDRWAADAGGAVDYYTYTLDECPRPDAPAGSPSCAGGPATAVDYGSAQSDYHTTVMRRKELQFLDEAPADRPFLLYLAPLAPHGARIPAPGDKGAYSSLPPLHSPAFAEQDVSDKPAWIRNITPLSAARQATYDSRREREYETMLGADRMVDDVLAKLAAKGELDHTVILYMTDNGFSYGEHRWFGKRCAYDECVRTPFLVRYPGATPHVDDHLVSNVDVAPTFAELAGITPPLAEDGTSIAPLLNGLDPPWRDSVLLELPGAQKPMPKWWAVRTEEYLYVELVTGERELYDLTGANGPADPYELQNRAGEPSYAVVQEQLALRLSALKGG